MGVIQKYFTNKGEMSEREYSYARIGFIADSAFANGAACFLAGSYLTGLLAMLGATEAQTNFILSLSMPAGFLQLLTPFLVRRLTYKKPLIFFCRVFETLLPAIAFLMPVIFDATKGAIWVIGSFIFIKYTLGWIMTPIYNDMLMKCLSKEGGIGKFSGTKSSVTNMVSCIGAFTAGVVIRSFTGDAERFGYMWLALIAIVLCSMQMTFLFFIKEPYSPITTEENNANAVTIFKNMFKIEKMRPYLKYNVLHTVGSNTAGTLIIIICIQRLGLSLEIISYLSVADLIARIILAPIFGRISDKIGSKKMLSFGLIMLSAVYIIHGTMTEENVLILKIIATAISCVGTAAINAPLFSFMFESMPEENRPSYMSCSTVLTLIISYIASLAVTTFMSVASGLNITVAGFTFHELNIPLFMGAAFVALATLPLIQRKH